MNIESKPLPFTILMADDDEDDILLTQDAMEAAGIVHNLMTVSDGQQLLSYLRAQDDEHKYPSVILLDLNMPIMDGREVLKELKNDALLKAIPVVILSTSSLDEDINQGYALGASAYFSKPDNFDTLVDLMKTFNLYWYEHASVPNIDANTH